MRKIYFILSLLMLACIGCEWHLRSDEHSKEPFMVIERYDKIETRYLTTGDVAALQQMNTSYPKQTRALIEDLLQLGQVNETPIQSRFYAYFQDTTLQVLLAEVDRQYDDIDDVNHQLSESFARLQQLLPNIELPVVYTQVGSLDQSILVEDGMLGISLDKYLGSDYPLYLRYGYSEQQRGMMTRDYIVPDCLSFFLLSLYPLSPDLENSVEQRRQHMGRIQYVVNKAMDSQVFQNEYVDAAERLLNMENLTLHQLVTRCNQL